MLVSNIYDNNEFFAAYAEMGRSKSGLKAAGEWHQLQPLFPELQGKKFWIWDAAMAGIVNMPHKWGRLKFSVLTAVKK